jgi:hypothetical protein
MSVQAAKQFPDRLQPNLDQDRGLIPVNVFVIELEFYLRTRDMVPAAVADALRIQTQKS